MRMGKRFMGLKPGGESFHSPVCAECGGSSGLRSCESFGAKRFHAADCFCLDCAGFRPVTDITGGGTLYGSVSCVPRSVITHAHTTAEGTAGRAGARRQYVTYHGVFRQSVVGELHADAKAGDFGLARGIGAVHRRHVIPRARAVDSRALHGEEL
jgi:hypothetical protein